MKCKSNCCLFWSQMGPTVPHCSLSHFRGEISFLLLCGVAQRQAWQRRDVERRLKRDFLGTKQASDDYIKHVINNHPRTQINLIRFPKIQGIPLVILGRHIAAKETIYVNWAREPRFTIDQLGSEMIPPSVIDGRWILFPSIWMIANDR